MISSPKPLSFFCGLLTQIIPLLGYTTPLSLKTRQVLLELGGYWRTPASEQFIQIEDLIGDQFTSNQQETSNGLFGIGYLLSTDSSLFKTTLHYGINAFYLGKTKVTGSVLQENTYSNLHYQYETTHYPVYAEIKALVPGSTKDAQHHLAFHAGIGPNFLNTTHFKETPIISNGQVIPFPNQNFSSHTTTTFSATLGLGFQLDHFFGKAPLECGYRFFYLGQGHLSISNDQIQNTLNTGPLYANAVVCSTSIG